MAGILDGAVDTGGYEWPTPWSEPEWRHEVAAWIKRELGRSDLTAPSGDTLVRLRPWSVILRLPTEAGSIVWFKASPRGSGFEPELAATLHRLVPNCTLAPIAINTARAWSLTPDGGELLAHTLPASLSGTRGWEEPLGQYSELQRQLAEHTEELIDLGVPDFRPANIPRRVMDVVDSADPIDPERSRHLRRQVESLEQQCTRLEEDGIPASLEHGDLHEGQVLVSDDGRYTYFDWGDSSVAHPFMSFLSTARFLRQRMPRHDIPRYIEAARSAYLEPWTGMGSSGRELRAALDTACLVGPVVKALGSGRLFRNPCGTDPDPSSDVIRSLEKFSAVGITP